jgi:caa(3)-type oxidase subunit IV
MKPGRGRSLAVALAALLLLAAASWALAHVGLGSLGAPVALAIACGKALLVAATFMNLSSDTVIARSALLIAAAFIVILSVGVVTDVWMR